MSLEGWCHSRRNAWYQSGMRSSVTIQHRHDIKVHDQQTCLIEEGQDQCECGHTRMASHLSLIIHTRAVYQLAMNRGEIHIYIHVLHRT